MFRLKIKTKYILSLGLICAILMPIFAPVTQAFFELEKQNSVPKIEKTKIISLLVDEELLIDENLKTKITRYGMDISQKLAAKVVLVPIPKNASPLDIWEGNAHLYFSGLEGDQKSQLIGTVLIGDVPIPVVDKGGNLLPTIFPYTDFENTAYVWDELENRFVRGQGDFESEIWHGVIRSAVMDSLGSREKELEDYFDRNHSFHTEGESFSKKVFFADLPLQKNGLPDELLQKYDDFIEHLEDLAYLRFNKHLLKKLLDDQNFDDAIPWEDIAKEAKPKESFNISDNIKYVPDIQTKSIIDNFVQRYVEIYKNHLSRWNKNIKNSGRWQPDEVDTTISLVTRKDELSALILRGANDAFEDILIEKLGQINADEDIETPLTEELLLTTGGDAGTSTAIIKPLYWNGVLRTDLTADDCSLNRGILKDDEHPFAVLAEANRTFNLNTTDSCAHKDETTSAKNADQYEGCCAKNILADGSMQISSNGACNTGSEWLPKEAALESAFIHYGAELSVFDVAGGVEVFTGQSGAIGCEPIFGYSSVLGFPSLMIHNEPTPETIKSQITNYGARSLPVDDPRGFSFYDHGNVFQRVKFPNLFDYRQRFTESQISELKDEIKNSLVNKIKEINAITVTGNAVSNAALELARTAWPLAPGAGECTYLKVETQLDEFTIKVEWNESCEVEQAADPDADPEDPLPDPIITNSNVVGFYETGGLIAENIFDEILEKIDLDEIVEAIYWIDKDIDEKNQIVFEKAFSVPEIYQEFFHDDGFNGYEFTEVLASPIEEGIEMNFEWGGIGFYDEEYEEALREARSFVFNSNYDQSKERILGVDSAELSVGQNFLFQDKDGEMKIMPTTLVSNSEVTEIRVEPAEIFIAANDVDPIKINISLRDKTGEIVETDFESEIKLVFSDTSKDFFRIAPFQETTVQHGEASFYLIPQTTDSAQELSFYAESEKLKSEKIDVEILNFDLSLTADKFIVPAKDSDGVLLKARIFDFEDNLSNDFDGEILEFTTDWGTFEGGINKVKIVNGIAELRFFPGKKAGEAEILVNDLKQKLPPQKLLLEIEPSAPVAIDLGSDRALVKGAGFTNISAQIVDEFGNHINDLETEFEWKTENLDLLNSSKTSLKNKANQSSDTIAIRSNGKENTARIEVFADILPKGTGRSVNFNVVENPILRAEISTEKIVAGQNEEVKIKVFAENEDQKRIRGDFEVTFSSSGDLFKNELNTFIVQDGVGKFDFMPSTKAGDFEIAITSPGFVPTKIDFSILPEVPVKIEISKQEGNIEMDEDESFFVDVRVVDKFGNIADFDDQIWIYPTTETADRIEREGTHVFLHDGIGKMEMWSKESGLVHLIARFESQEAADSTVTSLVLDVLEFEINNKFSVDDAEDLDSKSIFSMWLDFSGIDFLKPKSFANRILHNGDTLAIGTNIADPNPNFRFGFIAPGGKISKKITARLQEKEVLGFELSSEEKLLSRVQILFDEFAIFINQEKQEKNGIYLDFEQKISSEITEKEGKIFWNEDSLFVIQKLGGILIKNSEIKFKQQKKDSIFDWTIFLENKKIGNLKIVFENADLKSVDEFSTKDFGIFVKNEAQDIELQNIFTDNSTHGRQGFAFVSNQKKENFLKKLGKDKNSQRKIWEGDFKPAILFAGKNSAGESSKFGADDNFILLGDPTVATLTDNTKNSLGFTTDVGKPLWQAPKRMEIEQIQTGDINGDGNTDVFVRTGDFVYGLLADGTKTQNFRDVGAILRFADGGQFFYSLDNTDDKFTSFIQLNNAGKLVFHKNENGVLQRSEISFSEIERPIVALKKGDFNGDEVSDLVILDDWNGLWIALGNTESFDAPQKLDDFFPNFEESEEEFSVAVSKQGDFKRLQQKNNNPFLNEILISFKELASEDKIAEFLDKKPFVSLSDNTYVNAKFEISNDGKTIVQPDDLILAEFEVDADENLANFEFIIPDFENLSVVEDSFLCNGCFAKPVLNKVNNKLVAQKISIFKDKKTKFSWKMKVDKMIPIEFLVGDFDHRDDLDDISVPREISGKKKFMQFLSSPVQKTTSFFPKSWLVSLQTMFMTDEEEKVLELEKRTIGVEEFQTSPESTEDISTTYQTKMSATNLATGLPEGYNGVISQKVDLTSSISSASNQIDTALSEVRNNQNNFVCGDGTCGISIFSKAFMGPGLDVTYLSPLSFFSGANIGKPVFAFPTTRFTSHGPRISVWPLDAPGKQFPSVFTSVIRTYLSPTTTGKLGISNCLGLYVPNMVSPIFAPMCFVGVPSALPDFGITETLGLDDFVEDVNRTAFSATNFQTGESGSIFQVSASSSLNNEKGKSNDFKLADSIPKNGNTQIQTADFISNWVAKQYQEIGNFKFPEVIVKMPSLPGINGSTIKKITGAARQIVALEQNIGVEKHLFASLGSSTESTKESVKRGKASFEKELEDLNKSPFFSFEKRKVTIPIPKFKGGAFEKIDEKLAKMKTEIGTFSQKLKEEISNFDLNIDFDPQVLKGIVDEEIAGIKASFAQIDETLKSLKDLQAKIKSIDFEKTKSDLAKLKTSLKDIKANAKQAMENAPNAMVAANAKEVLDWADKLETKVDDNLKTIETYKAFSKTDLDGQIANIKKQFNSLLTNLENFDFGFDKDALAGEVKSLLTDTLNKFLKIPEEIEKQIEKLKKLPETIAELKNFPEKMMKMVQDLKKLETIFKDYLKLIQEGILTDIKKWLALRETLMQLMKVWDIIPQIFVGFTVGCPTPGCSADRGTLIQLLLKILLGSISLPVIPAPQLPNIILDLSNISFGLKVPIPELEFKDVELDISGLIPKISLPKVSLADLDLDLSAMIKEMIPSLADFGIKIPELDIPDFAMITSLPTDFDFTKKVSLPDIDIPSLPAMPNLNLGDLPLDFPENLNVNEMILSKIKDKLPLPNIPKLPTIPDLSLNFALPIPSLPPIPHLPAPPEIPDILSPLLAIVEIPKKIMKLICLLVMGVAPVPEWTVNAYVAQLTNRSILLNLDFSLGALFPSIPKMKLDPIVIAPKFSMEKEITTLIDTLKAVVSSYTDLITKFGAQNKLIDPIKDFKIPLNDWGSEISQKTEIISKSYTFNKNDFSDIQADPKIMAQISKIKEFPARMENEFFAQKFVANLKSVLPSAPKYLTNIQNPKMKQWNASINDFTISDQEVASVPETYPEPAPGIYFINPVTEEKEFLIDYKPETDSAITLANFEINTEGDMNYTLSERESVLYSIADLLFLKNKVEPNLQDEQAKLNNIIIWSFAEFKEKFAPLKSMRIRNSITGAEISVEHFDDLSYLEWTMTNRLDHSMETLTESKNRASQKWDRYGKLFRDNSSDSKIRSVSARVNKIWGSPIFYSTPDVEVPSCDDKIELYWGVNTFNTQTQSARFKVEKKDGNKINEEIVTLQRGEEFTIENAKICLLSGVGSRLETGNFQKFEAKRDFIFSPKFKIETGKNDSVELELFDGSILSVGGGENLTIETVVKGDSFDQSVLLPMDNFYGSVFAVKKNKKSFLMPTGIHDPQLSDDAKAPKIRIEGGTEIIVPVFQKVVIDATDSFDNREITEVFWDLNADLDSNSDGDTENDFDFPTSDLDFSAQELLKISLPARKSKGKSSIVLHTIDQSGNASSQKIEITAIAPEIKLFSASVRDKKIEGELKNKFANVPIYFNRKRNTRSEFIWKNPVFTDEKGKFEVQGIVDSGGIEVSENGKTVLEILPTGRPIMLDDRFNFQVLPATAKFPFQVRLHNEKNIPVGYILFETKEAPVVIQEFTEGFLTSNLTNLSGVNVLDRNLEDRFQFKKFPESSKNKNSVAIIDREKSETIGILDGFGNFYITPDSQISFKIKKAINDTDSVVFEILVNKVVIGEFVVILIPEVFVK
jgi:hypothetical protein